MIGGGGGARHRLSVLQHVDGWLVLAVAALCLCGLLFIGSATHDDPQFSNQQARQALFLACGFGIGAAAILPHYVHVMRASWTIFAAAVLALAALPFVAPEINGSRRWFALPGFSIQPSEFAKLAVIVVLAAVLRFKDRAKLTETLLVPMLITGVPALLILKQPDLGSTLVFGPILLSMCYAAGASGRTILLLLGSVAAIGLLGATDLLHEYQRDRIAAWLDHWTWTEADLSSPQVADVLRNDGYQPWQALIAIGAGGVTGFGIGHGPQNRFDFLPYRSEDYVFAVVAEETGFVGCAVVLSLMAVVVFRLLEIAQRTRERFGRLCCVGVAAWFGTQSLLHVAVCGWLLPSTGLPMPLVSYGGSSTLATLLALALCANIGARREPILGGDGYR